MAKKFKYDIYSLIELVDSKECLWDKTKEVSKDKILRKNTWHDICVFLERNFGRMDQKMKDEITTSVITKWNNIRDTFMKSLKTKSGQTTKRKYIYSDNLQFLLKTVTPDETDSSITLSINENRPKSEQSHGESLTSPSTSRLIRLNYVDAEILKAIQATPAESELIDDDRAFLMSLLPTVKKLNDDDKFEFRIEVMQLLRRFKHRRLSASSVISSARDFHRDFSPQQEISQFSPQQQTSQFSSQQETSIFLPQEDTPQFSSQQETPLPQQVIQLISPQQESTQLSFQQDSPVFINSIATLFSQDFSKIS